MSHVSIKNYGALSYSRVAKLCEDKNTAKYMGWWDKFKDLFRSLIGTPKEERLNKLWDELHVKNTANASSSGSCLFGSAADSPSPMLHDAQVNTKSVVDKMKKLEDRIRVFSEIGNLLEEKDWGAFQVAFCGGKVELLINYEIIKSIDVGDIDNLAIRNMCSSYGWSFTLVSPKDKNTRTREFFTEEQIIYNKKMAVEYYATFLKKKLDALKMEDDGCQAGVISAQGEDLEVAKIKQLEVPNLINENVHQYDKEKALKLIIFFNNLCNLVLRNQSPASFRYYELKDIAEVIYAKLGIDNDEEKKQFLNATLWLNFHRNNGQLAKQILKAVAIPAAYVAGLVCGPAIGVAEGIADGYRESATSLGDGLKTGAKNVAFGLVCGSVLYSTSYLDQALTYNTGDKLTLLTKSNKRAISLLESSIFKDRIIIEKYPGVPSIEDLIQFISSLEACYHAPDEHYSASDLPNLYYKHTPFLELIKIFMEELATRGSLDLHSKIAEVREETKRIMEFRKSKIKKPPAVKPRGLAEGS